MKKTKPKIRFRAPLLAPPTSMKLGSTTILTLPSGVSAKLRSRGSTEVDGTINSVPFPRARVLPNGEGSQWLRVNRVLREAAGAGIGDLVKMEIVPVEDQRESTPPTDLRQALAAAPKARALWDDITPLARRDWILWVESAKQPETRARRVKAACSMLAGGKRRVCCFDSYKARMDRVGLSRPSRPKK